MWSTAEIVDEWFYVLCMGRTVGSVRNGESGGGQRCERHRGEVHGPWTAWQVQSDAARRKAGIQRHGEGAVDRYGKCGKRRERGVECGQRVGSNVLERKTKFEDCTRDRKSTRLNSSH